MTATSPEQRHPHPALDGALVGLFVSVGLMGVLYLGNALVGLPFTPFDFFTWFSQALPGPLVTAGIDAMVDTLRALGLSVSDLAKTVEQAMALGMFAALGIAVGATLATLTPPRGTADLERLPGGRVPLSEALRRPAPAAGLVAGLVAFGLTFVGTAPKTGPLVSLLWLGVAFTAAGLVFDVALRRLAQADHSADESRRGFLLRLGTVAVGAPAVGGLIGRLLTGATQQETAAPGDYWSDTNALPNARATVEPVPGTRPELTPVPDHYRIDINVDQPSLDPAAWQLRVHGLVDQESNLTLDQLRGYPEQHAFVTLACISNRIAGDLISTTRWTGVSLQRLIEDFALQPEATHLHIRSADGFHEVVALDTIRADEQVMLTYAWDGAPLEDEHGFPLRIYIPNRYGMKQPKWIESIEVTGEWEAGYWVSRGWSREALMKNTSVIDTVGSDMMAVDTEPGDPVPIGGIAHAGDRGISRVEVQVDDGPWEAAEIREPLSGLTWVIWRYEWPMEPGNHRFTVRCFDGEGTAQIAEDSPVRPDGATGLHSVTAMF